MPRNSLLEDNSNVLVINSAYTYANGNLELDDNGDVVQFNVVDGTSNRLIDYEYVYSKINN